MNWDKETDIAITVCDENGIITYLNDKSADDLKKYGGQSLVGKSLFDCHNEKSNEIIRFILKEHKPNLYTTEKKGLKKFICQTPIFENGVFKGISEMVFELPADMPHYIRG